MKRAFCIIQITIFRVVFKWFCHPLKNLKFNLINKELCAAWFMCWSLGRDRQRDRGQMGEEYVERGMWRRLNDWIIMCDKQWRR